MEKGTKTESETKGRILRVKHGYNPNSSSIGSLVFAIPVALIGATVGLGVVSGIIVSAFLRDKNKPEQNSNEAAEGENRSSQEESKC